MERSHLIRSRVKEILLNDWDPHNLSSRPEAHSSYDAYIDPIVKLLESSADEDAIVQFLKERESETMCFPSLGTRRLVPVARKLIQLCDPQ